LVALTSLNLNLINTKVVDLSPLRKLPQLSTLRGEDSRGSGLSMDSLRT